MLFSLTHSVARSLVRKPNRNRVSVCERATVRHGSPQWLTIPCGLNTGKEEKKKRHSNSDQHFSEIEETLTMETILY